MSLTIAHRRYRKRKSPYPFETLRMCYVTKFGGVSPDLRHYQLGINVDALASNTQLVSKDRVAVGVLGRGRTRPFFMERLYEVRGLDRKTPDALFKSSMGEAVFSEKLDRNRKPFNSIREGQLVVLSGVLSDVSTPGKEWRLDLLAKALRELRVLDQ